MQNPHELEAHVTDTTHGHELTIQDWAHFVAFQPRLYFRPQDLDDLKGFLGGVQQGIFKQRPVRVLGSLHSCSDICVSDVVVDVSDLPKTIEFNADNTCVTATANWSLHDFLLELSAQRQVDHRDRRHRPADPGRRHLDQHCACFAGAHAVRIARMGGIPGHRRRRPGSGRKTCGPGRSRVPAVVASLGAIGILTKVQFRLVDEQYFDTIQKIVKLKEVLGDLAQTSRKYDFWRIDWLPDTDQGLLWAATRVPHADPNGDYPTDEAENILQVLFKVLGEISSAGTLLDNAMRLVYAGLALTYGETKASGPLRNMLPVDRRVPLRVAMAEWSFDPADLNRLMDACRAYFRQQGWPNLPIEIELTKTDDYYMSAWNWPGLDYIVKFNFMYLTGVSQAAGERTGIEAHLRGLWDHLVQSAIPFKAHWGKINFMDNDFVQAHYEYDRFKPFIRPVFLNGYLAERLNPAPVDGLAARGAG